MEPGQAIGLTAGTTTWLLAHHLVDVPGLTVVTNSLQVANVLYAERRPDLIVILTGGVRTPSDALVGPLAVATLRSLHVDLLFMGVHGMTVDAGFTTPNLLEGETDQAHLASAERVVVVADHTKWGVRGLSRIARLDEAHVIVTDAGLPAEARGELAEHVDQVVIAPGTRRKADASSSPRLRSRMSRRRAVSGATLRSPRTVPSCAPTCTPACRATSSPPGRSGRTCRRDVPVLPGRARGARRLRRALVPQPLAGDAGRALRGDPVHAAARRDACGRSARRARATSSTSGPSAPRRSARVPTSTTCSSSRTAAPRSERPSPTRTGRSTRSTSSPRPAARAGAGRAPSRSPATGSSAAAPGWRAWVPEAPVFPYALLLVPDEPVPDLPSLDSAGRAALAGSSSTCSSAWTGCSTRRRRTCSGSISVPSTAASGRAARLHVEIVSPWRARFVPRYVAAGELGSGVFFNPVAPDDAARALRDAC